MKLSAILIPSGTAARISVLGKKLGKACQVWINDNVAFSIIVRIDPQSIFFIAKRKLCGRRVRRCKYSLIHSSSASVTIQHSSAKTKAKRMFETETTLNSFLISGLQKVMADIPEDRINERAPGNGHPPLWVLGHLALVAEMGEKMLGGSIQHMSWIPVFGPGSPDDVPEPEKYSRSEMIDLIVTAYPRLCTTAQNADQSILSQPHGVELLADTEIVTVGDLIAHILTSHVAFHLAQLSTWRRAAGHGPLF